MISNALSLPRRRDNRTIIHFDYDCFYASVVEKENPALKHCCLAIQQKQIIVTCNYEARRRGLYKLQLVEEARRMCPDVVIILGEDLTRFRNASKDNYEFLRRFTWSDQVERLGFDEVFMDVTDMIEYNLELLNRRDLQNSFFHLDRNDPTLGFAYNASSFFGHTWPKSAAGHLAPIDAAPDDPDELMDRLRLGSHLAQHMRHALEEQKGYTSTVGISTNKLLSKLIGNVNKPKRQTTLLPPYTPNFQDESNVHSFIDAHDIGKIPGIGFKTAQKIRAHLLGRPAEFDSGLVYGGSRENVSVRDVRLHQPMNAAVLSQILDGSGVSKELPTKVWGLLHGVDEAEVGKAKDVPSQISMEDSYMKLDRLPAVIDEFKTLSISLLRRMREDLTTVDEDTEFTKATSGQGDPTANPSDGLSRRKWIAFPSVLRLSTRVRPPRAPDGSRQRNFARASRSASLPSFVFNLTASIDELSERLVEESILPLFRKLHPEKAGWNLSLVNVCVTNMTMAAGRDKHGIGVDIAQLFQRQETVHARFPTGDNNSFSNPSPPDPRYIANLPEPRRLQGSEDAPPSSQECLSDGELDECQNLEHEMCGECGAIMPSFAMGFHNSFHESPAAS